MYCTFICKAFGRDPSLPGGLYPDPGTLPRPRVESLPGYIFLSRESGCICIPGLWGGKGKRGWEGEEGVGRRGGGGKGMGGWEGEVGRGGGGGKGSGGGEGTGNFDKIM